MNYKLQWRYIILEMLQQLRIRIEAEIEEILLWDLEWGALDSISSVAVPAINFNQQTQDLVSTFNSFTQSLN